MHINPLNTELQELPTETKQYTYDDTGAADRLEQIVNGKFLYIRQDNKTMLFNGHVWHEDTEAQLERAFDRIAANVNSEPIHYVPTDSEDDHKRKIAAIKARDRFAKRVRSWRGKSDSINQFKTRITVGRDKFDQNPALLNTPAGVIDGDNPQHGLLPHEPNQYLSKITKGSPINDATCPRWVQFINEVTEGDADVAAFLQRAVGYSVFGRGRERKVFIIHGVGETNNTTNGKSVFVSTIAQVLGDYAATLTPGLFQEAKYDKDADAATPALIPLDGARFASAGETKKDRKLATGLLKSITSGERVPVRRLRQEQAEINVIGALWLTTNHVPAVDAAEEAMWRRLVLIPFTAHIEHPDIGLTDRMVKNEANGIMRWILDGYLSYMDQGLNIPDSIQLNGQEHRDEQDELKEFEADCIEFIAGRWLSSRLISETFELWAKERGITTRPKTFNNKFRERHRSKEHRVNNARGFDDMALTKEAEKKGADRFNQ